MLARLLFTLLLILFTNSLVLRAQEYVSKPESSISVLDNESIKPNEKIGAYYNEFWNYHVALENGAEVYITYSISHFGGVRGAVSGARFSLLNWDGKDYKAAREYDINKLIFEEETQKLNLNPERGIWFEGQLPEKHKIHFNTRKNDVLFDVNLDFINILPGITWGDGIYYLGENDKTGIFTHIPGADVSGFIALDNDTVHVAGSAYMDHSYQTNVGTRLFEQTFRFSKATYTGYVGGYFMIPKKAKNEIIGYAFEHIDGTTILKKPVSIETIEKDVFLDKEVSKTIQICYENETCDTFDVQEMTEKVEMLDELGGLRKVMAKRFLGGNIIELRGKAKLNEIEEVFYSLTILD